MGETSISTEHDPKVIAETALFSCQQILIDLLTKGENFLKGL